jgi:3-dehydroquinate synthetase
MIIWLQGPSGAGKTTVGRELAALRGLPFTDIDQEIEREEGRSIADIFWSDGEDYFRSLEWDRILKLAEDKETTRVVALGGGAVADPSVRRILRSTGIRVFLDVDPDTAMERLMGDTVARPMLMEEDPVAAWKALYRRRSRYYGEADLVIPAQADAATVTAHLDDELGTVERATWSVAVTLGDERTEIAGYRSLYVLMRELRRLVDGRMVCIVADSGVARNLEELIYGFTGSDQVTLTVESGEANKTMKTVEKFAAELVAAGFTREGVVVAIGGGVATDLAGFLASVYMRGVEAIYVPTTLLAQVDAAIGGKTAVNAGGIRNLIGTIRQPSHVLISPAFLRSLPGRELCSGFVESLKMGIANSSELAGAVAAASPSILAGDVPGNIDELIRLSVETKLAVVAQDTFDRSVRFSLNFGHTFGHALEAVVPGTYTHGEAVAFGIIAASEMAHERGIVSEERRRSIVEQALPFTLGTDEAVPVAPLLGAIRSDKKRTGTGLTFVLPAEETGVHIELVDDDSLIMRSIERSFALISKFHG